MADTNLVSNQSLNPVVSHIQFQEKYYQPETDLVTSDVTRAFLSKEGVNFVRRGTLVVAMLGKMGFYNSAEVVKEILGAYAIVTLGMGNFASMVTNYAWATRAFNYPQDIPQDDLMKSMKTVFEKLTPKRR